MPEPAPLTDAYLQQKRENALALAKVCVDQGYVQAGTIWRQTAQAIDAEIRTRAAQS